MESALCRLSGRTPDYDRWYHPQWLQPASLMIAAVCHYLLPWPLNKKKPATINIWRMNKWIGDTFLRRRNNCFYFFFACARQYIYECSSYLLRSIHLEQHICSLNVRIKCIHCKHIVEHNMCIVWTVCGYYEVFCFISILILTECPPFFFFVYVCLPLCQSGVGFVLVIVAMQSPHHITRYTGKCIRVPLLEKRPTKQKTDPCL